MSLNSTEFKYIDSLISHNKPNMGDIKINHSIQMTYAKFAYNLTVGQFEKLDVTYCSLLRKMIRGGFKSIGDNDEYFRYKLNN